MITYVVISKPGNVYGPFPSEQSAIDWMKVYRLGSLGWSVQPLLPVPNV